VALPNPQTAINQGQSLYSSANSLAGGSDAAPGDLRQMAVAIQGLAQDLPSGAIQTAVEDVAQIGLAAAAGAAMGSALGPEGTVVGAVVGAVVAIAEQILGLGGPPAQGDSRFLADRLCFPSTDASGNALGPSSPFAVLPGPVGVDLRLFGIFFQQATGYEAGQTVNGAPGDVTNWPTGNWGYAIGWNRPFPVSGVGGVTSSYDVTSLPACSPTTQQAAWAVAYAYLANDPISLTQGLAAACPCADGNDLGCQGCPGYTFGEKLAATVGAERAAQEALLGGAETFNAAIDLLDSWYGPQSTFTVPSQAVSGSWMSDYFLSACEFVFNGNNQMSPEQVAAKMALHAKNPLDYCYYPIPQTAPGSQGPGAANCELQLSAIDASQANLYQMVPDTTVLGLAEIAVMYAMGGIPGITTTAAVDRLALHYVTQQSWFFQNGLWQEENAYPSVNPAAQHANFARILGNIQGKIQAANQSTLSKVLTSPVTLGAGSLALAGAGVVGYRAFRDRVSFRESLRGTWRALVR
jgi:hypothetical protein